MHRQSFKSANNLMLKYNFRPFFFIICFCLELFTLGMNPSIIGLMFFLAFLGCSSGRRRKREIVNNQTSKTWEHHANISNLQTEVRLFDLSPMFTDPEEPEMTERLSNPTGLVEVLEPGSSEFLFLCFPHDIQEYQQAYIFSHVVCRQLGFMTFTTMHRRRTVNGELYNGLKPSSYACSGQEQNVCFCKKNNITRGNCRMLTEISCGACYSAVSGESGIIKTPGFPMAYLSDVTCEWDLTVPDDHSISMTFHHLDGLFSEFTAGDCPLHKSYVDFIYGRPMEMSIHRYCSLKELRNLTIPFHRVKIRLFTGISSKAHHQLQENEKGISISYNATLLEKSSNWIWKMVFLTLFILIFMATAVLCHFCQKYKLFPVQNRRDNELPIINLPAMEEIDKAYEFQRCIVQQPEKEKKGLRLRTNGSSARVRRIFFPSSGGTIYETPKTWRKPALEIETPKTIIPQTIVEDESGYGTQLGPLTRIKRNLLNRFSGSQSDNDTTERTEFTSSVFYPAAQSFEFYSSVSSEKDL